MRETIWLKDGFLFIKENGEKIAGQDPQIDTSAWENVRIPHDWAIGHDFKPDNDPKQVEKVNEDGTKTLVTQYGNTGALPTVGRGWYRKPLFFGKELEGKRIFLEFDGIMWRSEIYLNGSFAGKNHFGYMSFEVEITEFVKFGEENMLAILAEVDPDCSRWYSGAGIFRNIRLVIKEAAHIKYSGIHVKTPFVSDEKATLTAVVSTEGNADQIINTVVSPNGENLGEFALAEGLIGGANESKLLNYMTHHTLIDSVIKLGVIDLCQTRVEFEDTILAVSKGFAEVLASLQSANIVIEAPAASVSKPDAAVVIDGSNSEPLTQATTVSGKRVTMKNVTVEFAPTATATEAFVLREGANTVLDVQ